MKPIPFGTGVAPAITAIPNGWRIAYGGVPEGVVVLDVDTAGTVIVTRTFAGFGFPVLDGPWLGYKTTDAEGSCARLRNLADGSVWTYDPTPGNFPLAIGYGMFAWQTLPDYAIRWVSLIDPDRPLEYRLTGAPDGLAWIEPDGHPVLVKDVRTLIPGVLNPGRSWFAPFYTWVGEQPDLGPQWPLGMAVARSTTGPIGWLLGGQECNTPKIAQSADGQAYAIVTWGREGVRLVLLSRDELIALPSPPVVPSVPPQRPPMRPDRFWLGPNIASADLVRLFDDPAVLADVGVFQFYTQHILDNGGTVTGPNTFAALSANHVFKKLTAAGIGCALEGGSLSDLEAVTKIRAQGGDVQYFSISEPLVAKTTIADVVKVIKATKALGVKAGWIEAYSAIAFSAQRAFLNALIAAGAKPDYWHLDIDRRGAARDHQDVIAYVQVAKAAATAAGIPLGIILWGDDTRSDSEYMSDTLTFAKQVKAMVPVDQLIVQSWATRIGGIQDIPLNLGSTGLLSILHQTVQVFTTTPVPIPNPVPTGAGMFSTFNESHGLITVKQVKPVPGTKLFTLILPSDRVFSCQPDGQAQDRPPNADGGWERCTTTSSTATFQPAAGTFYTWPYVLVDGL